MADTKNDWVTGTYYHDNLKREVPIITKGGIGILSPDEYTHILVFPDLHQSILSGSQCLLGAGIESAKLVAEYMLSHISNWQGMQSFAPKKKKKAADVIIQLRRGGLFKFRLNGEEKQIGLIWEDEVNPITGTTQPK